MSRSAFAAALGATALGATALLGTTASAAAATAPPQHSPIFAGYEVSKPNVHVKHVSATFIVPTITCKQSFSGVGPSVLVYSDVNQRTGTHRTSGGGLGVACENGNPFYQSVFIVNDKTIQSGLLTLTPGDVVVVSVRVTPAGTNVTIQDTTSGMSKTHLGAGKTATQTFIGDNSVQVDGVSGKLDPFTPTHVSNVLVNNQALGSSNPTRFQWVRHGTTLVSAGLLQAGENFTLTFRSSG